MSNKAWWGSFSFNQQEEKCWSMGDRAIVIKCQNNEWNSWNIETNKENDSDLLVCNGTNFAIRNPAQLGRFLEKNTSNTIRVIPKLADKTVVARPSSPLTLLAGETVQLFISTPVWFYVETFPNLKCLLDIPFWRPSDTWFGASTIDGLLCYAKYTSAKISLEDLNMRAHRAVTPITVINNHDIAFTINRINVPVNYLDLYSDDKNHLWTSSVSISRVSESDNVELSINKSTAYFAQSHDLVSSPRMMADKGKLIRRISNLFG